MKIKIVVFWVVTTCSDVVRHQRFGGSFHLRLQDEGSSMALQNIVILPQHYTMSQPRSARPDTHFLFGRDYFQ